MIILPQRFCIPRTVAVILTSGHNGWAKAALRYLDGRYQRRGNPLIEKISRWEGNETSGMGAMDSNWWNSSDCVDDCQKTATRVGCHRSNNEWGTMSCVRKLTG